MSWLDADGDGEISSDELAALDIDGDGKISKVSLHFHAYNCQFLVPPLKAELRAALGSVLGLGSHTDQDTLVDMVMREAGDKDGDQELTVEEINTA